MLDLKREVLAKDVDVPHINKTKWKISLDLVHQALKSITSISQTKCHHQELNHPKEGDNGGLVDDLKLQYLIGSSAKLTHPGDK